MIVGQVSNCNTSTSSTSATLWFQRLATTLSTSDYSIPSLFSSERKLSIL